MHFLFGATLFASAFLLFSVQPLIAKLLLPVYGGTPAVWNTCLLFFQLLLLAGYAYAHALAQRTNERRQRLIHIGLVVLALTAAPALLYTSSIALRLSPQGIANPVGWVLAVLALSIGFPFFALSATAPLLQLWFARSGHPAGGDPYHLYVASNLGSMLALLTYPFVWEPHLTLPVQSLTWIGGYAVFAGMIVVCAAWSRYASTRPSSSPLPPLAGGEGKGEGGTESHDKARYSCTGEVPPSPPPLSPRERGERGEEFRRPRLELASKPEILQRLHWLALAFVPASLLYGITTYLTTDVAAVPLLWIVPLALYLLTFILMFAPLPPVRQGTLRQVFPVAVLAQTFFFSIQDVRPIWLLFALYLSVFFIVALTCHGALARGRPPAEYLTEFYLWLSLGGVLAGVFNALLAPRLFDSPIEYPLVLIASCLVVPMGTRTARAKLEWLDVWLPVALFLFLTSSIPVVRQHIDDLYLRATLLYGLPAAICYTFVNHPLRFTLGVMSLVMATTLSAVDTSLRLVDHSRNFFGVMRVVDAKDKDDPSLEFRRFVHGNTLHGMQRLDQGHRREALSYYSSNGPIGQFFETFSGNQAKKRVAVLGLGAGALAAYAEAGQSWTIVEIDPEVARVAQQHFTFLRDAEARGASIRLVLGDARLAMRNEPEAAFDLIFADAFSSDSVPVHLLTREALELYLEKLGDHGIVVFNVTNRCLDLEPVLARHAVELGLAGRIREEFPSDIAEEDKKLGKTPSRWIVLARTEADLSGLAKDARWRSLQARLAVAAWTDSYSNLLSVFRWLPGHIGHAGAR